MKQQEHQANTRKPINLMNLLAGMAFLSGSTLFLPIFHAFASLGVYLFMLGSTLMILDTLQIAFTGRATGRSLS